MARTGSRAGARALRSAAAAVPVLLLAATGCVTVHGEDALVPAVDEADAPGVVKRFVSTSNKANRTLDTELNATVETGVLAALDEASIKARRANSRDGAPEYAPLELTDTRYLVPELRGWPKWFVADTANNRGGDRWLIAFVRDGADRPWKASYLSVLQDGEMPRFATDGDGHAVAVAPDAAGLALAPEELPSAYADYLSAEDAGGGFAEGEHTSRLRALRAEQQRTDTHVTQYVDEPADEAAFAPVALRTADGGALVLFTSRHSWKVVYAQGVPVPRVDDYTAALMSGTPKRAVTRVAVAEQVAVVPKGEGDVVIADRIVGTVAARGE